MRKGNTTNYRSFIKLTTRVIKSEVENSFSVLFPWHDWLIIELHRYIMSGCGLTRSVWQKQFHESSDNTEEMENNSVHTVVKYTVLFLFILYF